MAAWAVRQYWNKCSQTGQKELVQRQVSSFTFFFAKSKTSKMDFALPKKSFAPQRPKVHKPDGKNMKNIYVLYVVFLGHFWPRLPRGFSVQYDTFIAEEGPTTRFMQLPLGWWSGLPFTKMYQQMCGENQKKTAETKKGRSFWMPANQYLSLGNIFGGEVHKTLEINDENMYPTWGN